MRSIRRTLSWSLSSVIVLTCLCAFLFVFFFVRTRLLQQFDVALRSTAESIGALLQSDRGQLGFDADDELLAEFRRSVRPCVYEIYSKQGQLLLRSDVVGTSPLLDSLSPEQVKDVSLGDGRPGRVICLWVVPRDESDEDEEQAARPPVPPVLLYVARDTIDLDRTLASMLVALGIALGSILGISSLIIPSLVRRGLKPLIELSAQAGALEVDRLSQPLELRDAPAEVLPIVRALNESLARIEKAFERERRFAADAAHELRTPLAAIRANAEVALRWPEPAQVRTALTDIAAASIRLHHLVEGLMELARAGSIRQSGETLEVDLAEVVTQQIEQSKTATERLRLNLEKGVRLVTVPAIFGSLIRNLFQNAVTHSPEGSEIQVDVSGSPRASFSITNEAPGLTPDDIAHMFDPLWTKSRDRTAGHAGLGLALVAEYARLLGVTVSTRLSEGHLVMRVTIP